MELYQKDCDVMSYFNKEKIEAKIEMWSEAEAAIATGQSYKIGSRELKRADLAEVRKQIEFWEGKLMAVERGSKRWHRRIVPRDL